LGRYTILEDSRIDEFIDEYLEKVVNFLLEKMSPSHVRSIILGGSYGKGDGSVLVDSQGVKPLRDFDLCVVAKEGKSYRKLSQMVATIQPQLQDKFCSLKDSEYRLMGDLIPEISVTTLDNINSLPDIASYDLKKCKVLYGEDIRPLIKWELKDLSLRTNARALFQKGIALIGAFHTRYLSDGIPDHLKDSFLRETSRAYIEICVGLCLLAKRYDSSCVKRLETMKEIYKKEFRDLYEKIPDLIDKIENSTSFKINPDKGNLNVNAINYWFDTRDDLGEVIKYYFKRYLGILFENWMQFTSSLETKLTKEYYLPIIDAYLRNKNLPTNSFFLRLFNFLFNTKENLEYSKLALKNKHLSLPLLYGISSPVIKLFFTAPLILFSIKRDGTTNSEYVDVVLRKLRFVKLLKKNYENKWEEARSKFLKVVFSVNMI